jgi:hypothetical protein
MLIVTTLETPLHAATMASKAMRKSEFKNMIVSTVGVTMASIKSSFLYHHRIAEFGVHAKPSKYSVSAKAPHTTKAMPQCINVNLMIGHGSIVRYVTTVPRTNGLACLS